MISQCTAYFDPVNVASSGTAIVCSVCQSTFTELASADHMTMTLPLLELLNGQGSAATQFFSVIREAMTEADGEEGATTNTVIMDAIRGLLDSTERPRREGTGSTTPRPASSRLIDSLQTKEVTEAWLHDESNTSGHAESSSQAAKECPICADSYRVGQTLIVLEKCKHEVHQSCCLEWLKVSATCPICRTSVNRPRRLLTRPLNAPAVQQPTEEVENYEFDDLDEFDEDEEEDDDDEDEEEDEDEDDEDDDDDGEDDDDDEDEDVSESDSENSDDNSNSDSSSNHSHPSETDSNHEQTVRARDRPRSSHQPITQQNLTLSENRSTNTTPRPTSDPSSRPDQTLTRSTRPTRSEPRTIPTRPLSTSTPSNPSNQPAPSNTITTTSAPSQSTSRRSRRQHSS